MLQFGKSIYPMFVYEHYLIYIFMKIHENLKNEGESRKTINLVDGGGW